MVYLVIVCVDLCECVYEGWLVWCNFVCFFGEGKGVGFFCFVEELCYVVGCNWVVWLDF